MKKNYILVTVLMAVLFSYGQTVTTILDSPEADVDDALALDSQGNLFGSTYYGGVVYKLTPEGDVSIFVSGLVNANGLAVDSADNIFVAEYGNGTINKYDNSGNQIQKFSVPSGLPSGLVKSYKSDNIIFTNADFVDPNNNSVNELLSDGSIRVLHQGAPLNIPVGLAYGPGGDLYVGNYLGRQIYRLPANGGPIEYVATVPAPDNFVPFLAFITYAQGYLYGTVYGENKIYQINPRNVDDVEIYSGSVFGDMDGNISEATYAFPSGILANKSGNTLYVSEFSGIGNIRKITNGNNPEVTKEDKMSMSVYPNPTEDFVEIVFNNSKVKQNKYKVDVKLYRISDGELVLNHKNVDIANDNYTLNIKKFKSGLYKLQVSNKNFSDSKTIVIK